MQRSEFQRYGGEGPGTEPEEESDETGSDSESGSEDGRVAAFDTWRRQASSWITAAPAAPVLPQRAAPPEASATDLPAELRGNDIRRHIICVDTQFRDAPERSSAADFYFSLLTPVRNVMRIRITSVEFPNNYPFFTALRRNVSFRLLYGPGLAASVAIVIPTGNYTAGDMVDTLQALVVAYVPDMVVSFSEITGRFTFTSPTTLFAIDTTYGGWSRPFAYGLGYYLGFTRAVHSSVADASGGQVVESDTCAYFAGDNYVFLRVNNYECVRQTTKENEFAALAKVVLREPKNYMTFDDYAGQHIKEVVFQTPVDLSRLQIQVLDPYGEVIDLCSSQWSMSLEVLEIKNQTLYDTVRDSLMLRYV
jgi:hypothetical protein